MSVIKKRIGLITLIAGVALLLAAIIFAFSVGTVAVPILFWASILVNSAGITILRGARSSARADSHLSEQGGAPDD